jgi:hypothetical protein
MSPDGSTWTRGRWSPLHRHRTTSSAGSSRRAQPMPSGRVAARPSRGRPVSAVNHLVGLSGSRSGLAPGRHGRGSGPDGSGLSSTAACPGGFPTPAVGRGRGGADTALAAVVAPGSSDPPEPAQPALRAAEQGVSRHATYRYVLSPGNHSMWHHRSPGCTTEREPDPTPTTHDRDQRRTAASTDGCTW